jgi:hypothetical protein
MEGKIIKKKFIEDESNHNSNQNNEESSNSNNNNYKKNVEYPSKGKTMSVSDKEILRIIQEQKNFPQIFSKRVKLSTLVEYYYKLWNHEFTDDIESDTDD